MVNTRAAPSLPLPIDPRTAIPVMPVVAMVLVVILLTAFLWLLHRNETEEEAVGLIKNVLWVEQNLRFQLDADENKLRQAADTAGREEMTAALPAFRQLLVAEPAILRLIYLDADGQAVLKLPPTDTAATPPQDGFTPLTEAFHISRSLGGRVYGTPYRLPGGGFAYDLLVPVFRNDKFVGAVAAVFSIDQILNHHVPWWFAEHYQLEVMDVRGQVLGAKSRLKIPPPHHSHTIPFEPPGHGLTLVATVHRGESNVARNVLVVAIFALTLAALWSLWMVRRHIRRRIDAEQALRSEYAFRKAMEDSLTVGMRARDLAGRVTYVNQAFCQMVGWTAAELVGKGPTMPYWIPEDMERTQTAFEAVMAGKAPVGGFELRFRRRNGERFDALIYEAPLIDADGRQTGWMGSVLDITQRRQAENLARQQQEKLQQTDRLITMGEMASTLAHELNQPLSAIAGYSAGCLNRIRADGATPADLEPALEKLSRQARRAGEIIRHVHDFVRKRDPSLVPCMLTDVLAQSVALFDLDARHPAIGIDTAAHQPIPPVMADPILLEQVLINLMRNGCEAMADAPLDQRRLQVGVTFDGSSVITRVRDQGPGISPETAESLFAPFYTTKREGMGMGLSICRSIVEQHGGRLWFENHQGGGAVFAFALPAASAAAEGETESP